MDWNTRAIEDLYLEPSDDSLDDDEPIYCVLSKEIDAVTFVDAEVAEGVGIRYLGNDGWQPLEPAH